MSTFKFKMPKNLVKPKILIKYHKQWDKEWVFYSFELFQTIQKFHYSNCIVRYLL